ncbi:hypothetical protein L1987_20232 [Smallanthus sonchifolius]|uniref:Uncharacterized protein n=1 Tax=Smallanthus sonchifolius TaxID=185202 RepID=A0ACB9ISY9_9ASTR|nr:hypothetical protein L1987_20232 [Smallanthus sonchifolius]
MNQDPTPQKKPYGGSYPLCNTCQYHHPNNLPCRKCTSCGKFGHLATLCRNPQQPQNTQAPPPNRNPPAITNGRACYHCGDPNHMSLQYPQNQNQNQHHHNNNPTNNNNRNQPPNQNQPTNPRGRAYNINTAHAQTDNDVVNGMFPIDGRYASVLFDTGVDKSFVSLEFELMLAKTRSKLENSFTVEIVDGKSTFCDTIILDCTLDLNGHPFSIDLIPMQLGSFDVIVGMDWLAKNHAEVVCFEKFIRIPLPSGQVLQINGERPSGGLKLMSCTKAQKYLLKNYVAFLAQVVKKKEKGKGVKDIPIICDFPEVFPEDLPGLPPFREVEFRIDLMPGTTPIAKAPYRLAPSEM